MSGLDVNARLTLDASGFIGPMTKAQSQAEATGRALQKSARDAATAQALAAKFGGDAVSAQSLRILAANKAVTEASREYRQMQSLVNKGSFDGATATNLEAAALQNKIRAQLESAAASRMQEHAEISQRMAASAAVRGVENGNVGVRAVENFLTTIPGVGSALQGIFPILGATAFVAMLVKGAEALYEMGEKAKNAGSAIAGAFKELDDRQKVTSDDLAITNQKLQDQIDKVSGHPNNGLATAILEAKKAADELLPALQADRKELEALLKEHNVGPFASLLSGVASTGRQQVEMLADQKGLSDAVSKANDEYDEAISKSNDPKVLKAAADRHNSQIHDFYQGQIDSYVRESKRLKDEAAQSVTDALAAGEAAGNSPLINNSAKISDVEGRIQMLRRQQTDQMVKAQIGERQATLGQAKQDAFNAPGDGQQKAARVQMEGFEQQLALKKMAHQVSTVEEYDYWAGLLAIAAKFPDNLRRVQEKVGELSQRLNAEIESYLKKSEEAAERAKSKQNEWEKSVLEMANQQDRAIHRDIDALAQLMAVSSKNSDLLQEMQVAHDAATGSITKQAAAMEMATLHARTYAAELAAIAQEKAADDADASLTPDQRKANEDQRSVRAATIQGEADRTAKTDEWAIQQETAVGGFLQAVQEMAAAAKDNASLMKQVTSGILSETNRTILEALTTRSTSSRHLLAGLGRSAATTVASAALTKGEGALATGLSSIFSKKDPGAANAISKLLGIGGDKAPKGTAGDPLHVIMAGVAGAASGIGGAVKSAASGMGGGISSLASKVLGLLPAFADGVSGFGGGWAMVGERGPELMKLPGGSSIFPNSKSASMMSGGGASHTWNIDARGSNDPAQTAALVRQGIMEATPHIMKATMERYDSNRSRMPSTARR